MGTDCWHNLEGRGGNCCDGKCVKKDKLMWDGYSPIWNKNASIKYPRTSNMIGIGWCPNDNNRPKKEGEKCSLATDCWHNLLSRGGNCCDKKCVKKNKMLWTAPGTSANVWNKNATISYKKTSDMGGIGWCPNDPSTARPKREGEKCNIATDCWHNLEGRGGNCCDGKCVKKDKLMWDGYSSIWNKNASIKYPRTSNMIGIGWCPNDNNRPKKEGEKCSLATDCWHNLLSRGGNCCD